MHPWLSANRKHLFAIFAYLDTPVSLSQWLLLKHGEWDQLATRWVDPMHYLEGSVSAFKYRRDVQAVDLLRKAPLPTTFSRRANALAAWESAETQCFKTNEFMIRLRSLRVTPGERRLPKFFRKVQKRLSRWLGPVPDDLLGGFGPGTCVEYDKANPTVVDKIWLTPTTTPAAAPYFQVLYGRTLWGLERTRANLPFLGTSRGNRLTTVPKDGKTDRPICIEPLGNLWLQLGVGKYLKKRLKLCGLPPFGDTQWEILPGLTIVRPDAQAVHRELARGGVENHLATIDLSSASDTIALELVRWLLPPDWFELLNDLRSPLTLVPSSDGSQHYRLLEKFSSMGNGFTFELETLLFLGLLSVAFDLTPGIDLWVFGDDIILPAEKGVEACALLKLVGFTPNLKKTYLSGPFRESCGGHFFSGLDVNPVRIMSASPTESIPQVFSLHNRLLRWGFPYRMLGWLREMVPMKFRISGPESLGDVVLHGGPYRVTHSNSIHWAKVVKFLPENEIPLSRWSEELAFSAILLGVPPRLVRRGTRVRPSIGRASVS